MGAGKIAVTARSSQRADLAMQLGASCFVAPSDTVVQDVNEALGGPPDLVFECVGVPGMIERSVQHVKQTGTVVVLGFCTERDQFLPVTALIKEANILFAVLYSIRDFQVCIDTLDSGAVEPRLMITDRVSLDQAPEMFEALRQRTHQCKVLIDPWLRT